MLIVRPPMTRSTTVNGTSARQMRPTVVQVRRPSRAPIRRSARLTASTSSSALFVTFSTVWAASEAFYVPMPRPAAHSFKSVLNALDGSLGGPGEPPIEHPDGVLTEMAHVDAYRPTVADDLRQAI